MPHPFDHPGNSPFVAIEMRLDRTVGAIAYPPGYSKLASLSLTPGAEEDTLNEAADPNVASNMRHQTVAMSGASSAFMPTTL
jgi:hypothetical protein